MKWGSIPSRHKRFILLQNIWASYGVHAASCPMVTGGFFLWGGHEFDYSPTCSAKVKNEWNCTSVLLVSFCAMDRYNFNVIFIYLFSRLFDVSTSSCAHLTIILSFSSNCLCPSSLLPLIPFLPSIL